MDQQTIELLERIRRFAMPDGPVEGGGTWIRQAGEMRFAPDRPWMPFRAEQWFEGDGIDFRWEAQVRMAPLLRASVVDAFERGRGVLVARVLGVFPVARSRGPITDRGEALRGLAELPWHPFAFREAPGFAWQARDDGGLGITFDDGRTHASLEFEVDGEGRVLGVTASRPHGSERTAVEMPWSGRFSGWRPLGGLRVPTVAEVAWTLPGGPFTYWRGRVTELRVLPRSPEPRGPA